MDDNSEPTLLTLGVYSLVNEDEEKYKVTHNERQWLLHINRIQVSDKGRYMCQINAQKMTSQTGFLDVYGKVKGFFIGELMQFGCLNRTSCDQRRAY